MWTDICDLRNELSRFDECQSTEEKLASLRDCMREIVFALESAYDKIESLENKVERMEDDE